MLVKQREDCKRWLPFKHTHSHFIFLRSDLQHQRSIALIIITLCRVCGREKCFNITHGRLFSLLPSHAPYVSFCLLSVAVCLSYLHANLKAFSAPPSLRFDANTFTPASLCHLFSLLSRHIPAPVLSPGQTLL